MKKNLWPVRSATGNSLTLLNLGIDQLWRYWSHCCIQFTALETESLLSLGIKQNQNLFWSLLINGEKSPTGQICIRKFLNAADSRDRPSMEIIEAIVAFNLQLQQNPRENYSRSRRPRAERVIHNFIVFSNISLSK